MVKGRHTWFLGMPARRSLLSFVGYAIQTRRVLPLLPNSSFSQVGDTDAGPFFELSESRLKTCGLPYGYAYSVVLLYVYNMGFFRFPPSHYLDSTHLSPNTL
jgi:hypothetical protein